MLCSDTNPRLLVGLSSSRWAMRLWLRWRLLIALAMLKTPGAVGPLLGHAARERVGYGKSGEPCAHFANPSAVLGAAGLECARIAVAREFRGTERTKCAGKAFIGAGLIWKRGRTVVEAARRLPRTQPRTVVALEGQTAPLAQKFAPDPERRRRRSPQERHISNH